MGFRGELVREAEEEVEDREGGFVGFGGDARGEVEGEGAAFAGFGVVESAGGC